ncbi:uncharacterized protein LOC129926427 [Biomphalaria glabrata]|uniref:Uncharacterized protein LOC129926427 n=1 Tax=Biomphalaria glabrata TaxID=6526 RepID=A0A9W3AGB0_BIOGL|nr:uncharacterized protein LOC129926427 [Biomphalaria glabrata]XP_055886323.1 uncharacterized protein LOC129926427 [Biomphalaria glabrata]XP_055886324.1 uncharacterized protein LOC129926427 [Biomphalaria glabrata]XP_055886325.1 uncharacterized protein LOC129926427 [Biomphalaria glabrata]
MDNEQSQLLNLPQEILLIIIQYLPSSSLTACCQVHPKLKDLVHHHHFLDRHFRSTLGLLSGKDEDISYDMVPKEMPNLMHLWFYTHNAVTSGKTLLSRDSLFYPLECFHHSLLTWLAQAISTKPGIFEGNHNLASSYSNFTDYHKSNLFKIVYRLPSFVLKPLTKLALLFPDLIWRTILATHCSLHDGKPVNLQNVWYDGFTTDQRDHFDNQFCMEILCDYTKDYFAKMSALLILFRKDRCILWTGVVACFPGCKFEETWAIASLDSTSNVECTKSRCQTVIQTFLTNASTETATNCQWKKRNIYPGLCFHIQSSCRESLTSHLQKEIEQLSLCLKEVLNSGDILKTEIPVLEPNSLQEVIKFNRSRDNVLNEPKQNNSDLSTDDIAASILKHLHYIYRQEVMEYFTDPDTHEVLCPDCSRKWFISNCEIMKCIDQARSCTCLPLHFWPYHCLQGALSKIIHSQNIVF